uniref:myelin protein zero-like protein 2 n=1 Tax=Semicossyphus pulcher TaxID=241346 RepID=UPI0037E9779D
MYQKILLFVLLGAFAVPGIRQVTGISVFTAAEVEAVNGTDVKLKCIFSSSYPVSLSTVVVSWSFRPLHSAREESVFHYQMRPYPPSAGPFRKRVVWSGDVLNKDGSITLQQVSPAFQGTYSCTVKNIPDVHGRDGEVVLRVVNKTLRFDQLLLFDWMGV